MIGTIRFRAWGTVINYYEHHIGDYAAATAHLSLIEDAIYSRMLRRYYLQEVPLPADVSQVARLVGARGADEVEAVRVVLGEFFVVHVDPILCHCRRSVEKLQLKSNKRRTVKRGNKFLNPCYRVGFRFVPISLSGS